MATEYDPLKKKIIAKVDLLEEIAGICSLRLVGKAAADCSKVSRAIARRLIMLGYLRRKAGIYEFSE